MSDAVPHDTDGNIGGWPTVKEIINGEGKAGDVVVPSSTLGLSETEDKLALTKGRGENDEEIFVKNRLDDLSARSKDEEPNRKASDGDNESKLDKEGFSPSEQEQDMGNRLNDQLVAEAKDSDATVEAGGVQGSAMGTGDTGNAKNILGTEGFNAVNGTNDSKESESKDAKGGDSKDNKDEEDNGFPSESEAVAVEGKEGGSNSEPPVASARKKASDDKDELYSQLDVDSSKNKQPEVPSERSNLPQIDAPNYTGQTRYITLKLRPRDGTWVMDEDLVVSASVDITIIDLKRWLQASRNIPSERIVVYTGKQELPVPKLREPWAIKRIGIGNNEVLIVSPTKRGGWLWHPIQYYYDVVIDAVLGEINRKGQYVRLDHLQEKIQKPPPLSESLLVLLRQYPDRVHIRTDLVTGLIWVGRAPRSDDSVLSLPAEKMVAAMYLLPTFEGGVVDMDTQFPGPEITDIDWSQYDDIDNTGFDMSSVVVPDTLYYIIFPISDLRLKQIDVFNLPNVFIEIIFKGVFVARTSLKCRTLRPSWIREKLMLVVRAQEEIRQCTLRINVFSFEIPAKVGLIATAFYSDADIFDLMVGRVTNVTDTLKLKEYPAASPNAEGKAQDQADVPTVADAKSGDATLPRSRSGSVFASRLSGASDGDSVSINQSNLFGNRFSRSSNASAVDVSDDDGAMAEGDDVPLETPKEVTLDYFRPFDQKALEEDQLKLVPSLSKLMIQVIHSEYEMRVLFCSSILNIEDPTGSLKFFVSIIFNGRELFTSSVQEGAAPRWENPPTIFIRLGGLELHECTMTIETWKMGETGRENKLGMVEYTGKQFSTLMSECDKRVQRYAADLYILPKSKEAKDEPGKKKKIVKKGPAAKPIKTGIISFDIGPPGLPDGSFKSFEIQIMSGVDLPCEKVICDVYWNEICIGMTNVAVCTNFTAMQETNEDEILVLSDSEEEEEDEFVKTQKEKAKQRETKEQKKARREKAKKDREAAEAAAIAKAKADAAAEKLSDPWIWAPKPFKVSIYDDSDLLAGSFKIYICDGSGKINPKHPSARLGCLHFIGENLVNLLTFPDKYAKEVVQDVIKDAADKRPQKVGPKGLGKVKLRCSLAGARMAHERTVLLLACKLELNQLIKFWKPHIPLEVLPDKIDYFVKVYFNDLYLGDSTTCTVEDGQYPWWTDSWVHLPVGDLPLKECVVRFELFMLFTPGNEEPETTNMLGITTGRKSQIPKGAALPEKDNKRVYTPFILGSAVVTGRDLKSLAGPSEGSVREYNLEPYVTQEKKKSWFDKSSAVDSNRTHQLISGVIQVGSPGTKYVLADESTKAKTKELEDTFQMYHSKYPPTVVVPVLSKPEGAEQQETETAAATTDGVSDDPESQGNSAVQEKAVQENQLSGGASSAAAPAPESAAGGTEGSSSSSDSESSSGENEA